MICRVATALLLLSLCLSVVAQTFPQKIVGAYANQLNLQQLDPNTPNNVVVLEGQTLAGDGNGGIWAYDPKSTATINGTNVIGSVLGSGRWLKRWGGSGVIPWKLGNVLPGAGLALVTTNYVEVNIGGVVKKLALVQ